MKNGVMKRFRWAAPGRLIPWKRDRQVAIVGLARSGKTTFLTSLINHLKYHAPERFSFGRDDLYVSHFQEDEPSKPDGWPTFPYTAHRQGLVEQGRWPVKTKDHSAFRCQFRLGAGHVRLALYDVPGERMATAAMTTFFGLPRWSMPKASLAQCGSRPRISRWANSMRTVACDSPGLPDTRGSVILCRRGRGVHGFELVGG